MATRKARTKRRTGGDYPIPFDPIDGGCMHYPERQYKGGNTDHGSIIHHATR